MGHTKLERTLIKALAFYASPQTYHACAFWFDRPTGGFDRDFSHDAEYGRPMPGKRARAALSKASGRAPTNKEE